MSISNAKSNVSSVPPSHSKRRLSLFSFGLSSSTLSLNLPTQNSTDPTDRTQSTNENTTRNVSTPNVNQTTRSNSINKNLTPFPKSNSSSSTTEQEIPNSSTKSVNTQLDSPLNSPLADGTASSSFNIRETPDSNIFERSVQDFHFDPPTNRSNSFKIKESHRNSTALLKNTNQFQFPQVKNEDYIPPALDATTSILNNKNTNLDDVEMIYSNRRNSSVIGLNMALGKPFSPSRKNSTYSINQQLHPLTVNDSPFSQQQQQQQQQPPFLNKNANQPQSPVSPPKLTSSKSSVSFYSYADMINNDEFAKRPSFKQSYSQGIIPATSRKQSTSSILGLGPYSPTVGHNGGGSSYFPKVSNAKNSKLQQANSPSFPQSHYQSQLSRNLSIQEGISLSTPPSSTQLAQSTGGQLHTINDNNNNNQNINNNNNNNNNSIRPHSVSSSSAVPGSTSSSLKQNYGRFNSHASIHRFLISPESSDLEDHNEVFYPAFNSLNKRKSLTSTSSQLNSIHDDESLVSSSIADCIRQSTTEINGH